MKFEHDFGKDLTTLLHEIEHGEPFAFTKFADGERAILEDKQIPTADGWTVGDQKFRARLQETLTANMVGYYVGISCECCGGSDHQFYLDQLTMPLWRVTFANIFVNGNYGRWSEYLSGFAVRCSVLMITSSPAFSRPEFGIPKNAVNAEWDIDGLVSRMIAYGGSYPIFVAAGPAGNIIVHEYWKRGPRNRTIIDVGSTLDPWIHGRGTRGYHDPNHPNRQKICRW